MPLGEISRSTHATMVRCALHDYIQRYAGEADHRDTMRVVRFTQSV